MDRQRAFPPRSSGEKLRQVLQPSTMSAPDLDQVRQQLAGLRGVPISYLAVTVILITLAIVQECTPIGLAHWLAETFHTELPTSSATSNAPSWSWARPTGAPKSFD
jgi:hypothetical protein